MAKRSLTVESVASNPSIEKDLLATAKVYRAALAKSCEFIAEFSGDCPGGEFGWNHPDGCDDVCDDQCAECYALYFIEIITASDAAAGRPG